MHDLQKAFQLFQESIRREPATRVPASQQEGWRFKNNELLFVKRYRAEV
jgi:hypothetical protein